MLCHQVVLCRLTPTDDGNPCEIIKVIRDDDVNPPQGFRYVVSCADERVSQAEASNCSCTWTRDAETGRPYLCVGGRDAKIKVYDFISGKLVNVSCHLLHLFMSNYFGMLLTLLSVSLVTEGSVMSSAAT